jgi:pilus assembly protein CpaB
MRNARPIVMLTLSLVFGVIAVMFAANWSSGTRSGSTVKVVLAAKEIPLGTPLTTPFLKTVEWPQANALPGSFQDATALEGRVVKTTLVPGEPIIEAKLAPPGASGGLASSITEGRRAITVKVNEVVGVAGFALPGNYVDVLVNMKEGQEKPVSKIVLEHILVLAIAQEATRDDTKPKVVNAVTLEVTPQQAERLDLARSVGNLSLVLRNQIDSQAATTSGARPGELLASSSKGADAFTLTDQTADNTGQRARNTAQVGATAVRRKPVHVELLQGTDRTTMQF